MVAGQPQAARERSTDMTESTVRRVAIPGCEFLMVSYIRVPRIATARTGCPYNPACLHVIAIGNVGIRIGNAQHDAKYLGLTRMK